MRVVKLGYSRNPWRLVTDDGREVVSDLLNDSGRVVATCHPVCGNTKQEVTDWALKRLAWYIRHAQMGVLPAIGPGCKWTQPEEAK